MLARVQKPTVIALTSVLLSAPAALRAEEHVLSNAELRSAIETAAQKRQSDLESVQKFFRTASVRKALKSARVDYSKIEKKVPLLSDRELSLLASQTQKYESDLAAGALTNQQITYILIALATAVIVLIAVH